MIRIPDSNLIEEIKRVIDGNGGITPTTMEFSRLANVSIATIRDRFGSYPLAIARAGFVYTPPSAKYTSDHILAHLRNALEKNSNYRFSFNWYRQYGGTFARQTIMDALGAHRWAEVMEVIGATASPLIATAKNPVRNERRRDDLSDDDLLSEIGRAWNAKGMRPTSTEFAQSSNIGSETYCLRFGSWAATIEIYCKNNGITLQHRAGTHVTKQMLTDELRTICGKRPGDLLTYDLYKARGGTYSKGPFFSHFGTWMNAVKAAGGVSGGVRKYLIDQLFNELQRLWEEVGQQPTWHEMASTGNISPKVYERAFGSWKKAVIAFCQDRNAVAVESPEEISAVGLAIEVFRPPTVMDEKTELLALERPKDLLDSDGTSIRVPQRSRYPSPKLRFQIFLRDKFSCQFCGRTHKADGVAIVVDHIIPYSRGGNTVMDNLQLLCGDCNSGKSNALIN